MEQALRNSTTALTAVKRYIERREAELQALMLKTSNYDKPSWGNYAAHRLGTLQAYDEVKNLLSFIK